MIRFDVYRNGEASQQVDLNGAYLFGQDTIPVRADLAASGNQIVARKRVAGACGLSLMWDVQGVGRFLLSTTRLLERNKPYNLNVELARSELGRIIQKREDWGLFDYADAEALNSELDQHRAKFSQALQCDDPAQAALLADEALAGGLVLAEKMSLFHADVLLSRRRASSSGIHFGCRVDLASSSEDYAERLREAVDFIQLPLPWKVIEPEEHQHQYAASDAWINWAARNRKPVHAGPLVSFDPVNLPDWTYLWENDFEALRDLIYEHVQRTVQRYERQVRTWSVVCGIHAHNTFNLNFEQLMEITRMSCLLVKKLAPRSQVMIELVLPWGEYYARNQRTIPPLLYADMAAQGGVKFDAFGVQLCMGVPVDGHYVRDLLQVSAMLDEFAGFSKPLHVTASQVPSDITLDTADAWEGKESPAQGGIWHAPWSPRLQAEWLQAFCRISMSKPYVETVCWRDLADTNGHYIPNGGLCRKNLEPKLAFKELRNFRLAVQAAEKRVLNKPNNGKA